MDNTVNGRMVHRINFLILLNFNFTFNPPYTKIILHNNSFYKVNYIIGIIYVLAIVC